MKKMTWVLSVIWTVCLLGICSLAFAETEEDSKKASQLEEVTVTATKYETSVKNVPASVTIIHAEQLSNQNFPNQDIGDALRDVAGITLRRAYAPFIANANIRGVGSGGTIGLVNGIPTDWQITQAIPIEMVDRIEIIRGPASALYGANAAGGVVNIILKQGKKVPKTTIKGGYGSFDHYRGSLATEGEFDKFNIALAGFYEESDGTNVVENNVNASIHMIDDCDYDKRGVTVNSGYDFTDRTQLQFFYSYMNNQYTRGRPNVGGDWDYNMAALTLNQDLGDTIHLRAYAAYRKDDYLHLYDRGGTNYDPSRKRNMDLEETPLELQGIFRLGGSHTLTSGFFFNNQSTDQEYTDLTGYTSSYNYGLEYKVQTLAGYLQDVWNITDKWVMTLGARYDHWKNYDNYFDKYSNPDPGDRTDSNISPKAGIRFNLDSATSFWGSYAMGFTPPTPDQLYNNSTSGGSPRVANPDLKPETTNSFEIGADKWFGNRFQSTTTCFYSYTKDKIMSWFDASNVWVNKNIGESESYGVEFSLAYYLTDNWTLKANYTYNKATISDNPSDASIEGNYLPFCPKHKANFNVIYNQPGNFGVSAGVRYLSKQYSNDANTETNSNGEDLMMDASVVVDLKGTKHFMINKGFIKQIDLSLGIDNLFDEEYRTMYMYEDPGTTYYAEVGFSF